MDVTSKLPVAHVVTSESSTVNAQTSDSNTAHAAMSELHATQVRTAMSTATDVVTSQVVSTHSRVLPTVGPITNSHLEASAAADSSRAPLFDVPPLSTASRGPSTPAPVWSPPAALPLLPTVVYLQERRQSRLTGLLEGQRP